MLLSDPSNIAVWGAAGLGLVWGWLAALPVGPTRRKLVTPAAVSLASVLVAAEVMWMLGVAAAAITTGTTLLSFGVHAAWRLWLRQSVSQSISNPGGQP
jgi:hypothetical protein